MGDHEPNIVLKVAMESIEAHKRIGLAGYLRDLLAIRDDHDQPILLQHQPGMPPTELPAGWVKVPVDVGALGDFYAPPEIRDEILRSEREAARAADRQVARFKKELGGKRSGPLTRLRRSR